LLLPAVLAGGRDGKRGGGAGSLDVCQSDAGIEAQCAEAFNTVAHFELSHPVNADRMAAEYLQVRQTYIDTAFAMADGLALRPETAHDAALLMDRVMATGTGLTDGLSRLFVAAALRVRGGRLLAGVVGGRGSGGLGGCSDVLLWGPRMR